MQGVTAEKTVRGSRSRGYYDYNLLAVVIILICFGLMMLYSASAYEASNMFGNDMYYFTRQTLISAGAVVMALVIARNDYHVFMKWSPFFLGWR